MDNGTIIINTDFINALVEKSLSKKFGFPIKIVDVFPMNITGSKLKIIWKKVKEPAKKKET